MSAIRGLIGLHKGRQSDSRRVRTQVESMWADAAARKFLDVVDNLDQADRNYLGALLDLDSALDLANQMLGP